MPWDACVWNSVERSRLEIEIWESQRVGGISNPDIAETPPSESAHRGLRSRTLPPIEVSEMKSTLQRD